jgi:hypothetical protein
MTRRALVAAAFALLFAGSETSTAQTGGPSGHPPGRTVCNMSVCQIKVDVTGTPPRIIVDVDELVVAKGNRGSDGDGVKIQWHLQNNDYEFKDDSIQYYDRRYWEQFDQLSGAGPQFQCRSKNTAAGRWGYLIKVYHRRTGDPISLDPVIINDGP